MSATSSLKNLSSYLKENGLVETIKFVGVKIRSRLARSGFGWKCFFEYNPFVSTGTIKDYTEQSSAVFSNLAKLPNLELQEYSIDLDKFRAYIESANYSEYGPYYEGAGSGDERHRVEKFLQHYLSLEFLDISVDDVYVDVASNTSPMKEIIRNMYGAQTFGMDLAFPPGVNGDTIGCDAGDTKLDDESISKMSLHCAFEHFANGADTRFVKEAGRILKPGGKVCIVPLYILNDYCIRRDPTLEEDLSIDDPEGAELVWVRDYNVPYGRFYNPEHFKQRILDHLGCLRAHIYHPTNLSSITEGECYSQFVLVLEKPL
jgi:SAM-dependent methyltransferase